MQQQRHLTYNDTSTEQLREQKYLLKNLMKNKLPIWNCMPQLKAQVIFSLTQQASGKCSRIQKISFQVLSDGSRCGFSSLFNKTSLFIEKSHQIQIL